jgi:hypothetical protein
MMTRLRAAGYKSAARMSTRLNRAALPLLSLDRPACDESVRRKAAILVRGIGFFSPIKRRTDSVLSEEIVGTRENSRWAWEPRALC